MNHEIPKQTREVFLNEEDLVMESMVLGGNPDDIVVINSKRLKKIPTSWTEKQYFSHSTEEAGSGPGWDFRLKYMINKGINILEGDPLEKLSNERLYKLERIDK